MTVKRTPSWEEIVAGELCEICHVRPKKARDLCGLCHMVTYGDAGTKPILVVTTASALSDLERHRILKAVDEATAREQTEETKRAAARAAATGELEALGHDGSELEQPHTSLYSSLVWGCVIGVGVAVITIAVSTALSNLH